MSTHKPSSDFERHELAAFTAFRRSGDVTGMLTLADHCDESGEDWYAKLLRLVCDPPGIYQDLRRTDFEAARWFLSQCWCHGPPGASVLRDAARLALAEANAMRKEVTRSWRYLWRYQVQDDPANTWDCFLEERPREPPHNGLYGEYWRSLDALHGIDLGTNGRGPATPLHQVKWGEPYGPNAYCRVVTARLAEGHTEFPEELKPWRAA